MMKLQAGYHECRAHSHAGISSMGAVKWGRFWQSLQALGPRPSSPQLSHLIQMKS